jgi:hypothetical protein
VAKQFSILLTAGDLAQLERVLRESGDVDLLSLEPDSELTDLLPLASLPIPDDRMGKTSLFCVLAPSRLPRRVTIERDGPVKTHVDLEHSHVIELWRTWHADGLMRRGRLYYCNRMLAGGQVIAKDPSFTKWADGVMGRVKKALSYDKAERAHVGAEAGVLIAEGRVKVQA